MTEHQQIRGRRLGRLAPSNRPALRLADVLRAVPNHPGRVDYLARVADFGMYGNDNYGDCGPVSVANSLKVITSLGDDREVSVSQDDVFDLYRRSGNPNFDPRTDADDNGVVMQAMLDALLKGGIGGRYPIAFAKVDVSNIDEVRAAIAYFGCVLLGVNLEVAQQQQSAVWDYQQSAEWGGHAVVAGSYTGNLPQGDIGVISWAAPVWLTDAFAAHQLDEAWVVVWPEHLKHPAFLDGVDVAKLSAAYTALTGKTLPIDPTPPAPTPTPAPTPNPGAAPFPGASPAVAARVAALAARHSMTTSDYLNFLLERIFHLPLAANEFGNDVA